MGFEAIDNNAAGIANGVGTGLQVAGALSQTSGVYAKSSLEGQAYGFQSGIARRNATIANYQASDALLRGQRNVTIANYQASDALARGAASATIAKQQASDALTRGATNENISRQKTAQLKGTQTAELAARNIDLGSGSALDILTSTDFMGERDALTVRDNANKEAWGHQVEASNFTSNASREAWGHQVDASNFTSNASKEAWGHQVDASNFNANADLLAWRASAQDPTADATGTLLGTAGKVASGWYTMANARTGYSPPAYDVNTYAAIDMGV